MRGLQTKARFDSLAGEGITNEYDRLGRLTSTNTNQSGPSRSLAFLYNPDGTRSRITHADQAKFGYAHDALGRMTMHYEISATPGIDEHIIRYWYNPTGTRYAAVRGAGTMGFTTTAYYDPVDRPGSMHNGLPGTAHDLSLTFAYNPASQIVTSTRSNDAYAWTGTVPPSTGYAVNGQNQYTSVAGVTHLYDANGNLTSDGASTFTYDVENRLVAASGARTASLVYDPLGRLFQTSGGAAGVTQFLYDGDALVAEYNASGALLKRYIHGPGADEPVAVYEGPAQGLANRRYTLPDQQGSVLALINADGTPFVINSYDPWGVPGANNAGRFQYTGQAWIPELGLYYYKARFYSPGLGRFLQTDPVGYADHINLYGYAANDPVNGTDPSGEAVVINKNGTQIALTFYLAYYGPGNTAAARQSIERGIASGWTGKFGRYTVDAKVVSLTFRPGTQPMPDKYGYSPRLNFVLIYSGNQRERTKNSRWVSLGNKRPPWTAAHFAGHLAGLGDKYDLSTGAPFSGYETSIMGARDERPREDTIEDMLAENGVKSGKEPGSEGQFPNIDSPEDVCRWKGCAPGTLPERPR